MNQPSSDRPPLTLPLPVRAGAEALGTALLLVAVVGSGISGERLSGGNAALALLANSLCTGAALTALILSLGPISGSHFNPAVTLVESLRRRLPWTDFASYVLAQVGGAVAGVAAAHAMFGEPVFSVSRRVRSGAPLLFAEVVATVGLLVVIRGASRLGTPAVALAVGGWIAGAYWFTSSTSFANPAVTLARTLTDTFSGIRPADAPGFVAAQLAAAAAAAGFSGVVPKRPQ